LFDFLAPKQPLTLCSKEGLSKLKSTDDDIRKKSLFDFLAPKQPLTLCSKEGLSKLKSTDMMTQDRNEKNHYLPFLHLNTSLQVSFFTLPKSYFTQGIMFSIKTMT
jgi:hypothetical protein